LNSIFFNLKNKHNNFGHTNCKLFIEVHKRSKLLQNNFQIQPDQAALLGGKKGRATFL